MYAAGINASMGAGDHHFTNTLVDPNDSYELGSAAAMVAASSGNPSDLLMGLSGGSAANAADLHALASNSTNLTKEQLNAQQEAIRACVF
jgi:hypothetical protein